MALCRACGQSIVFVTTPRGKLQPRDLDGEVHFARCPARASSPHPPAVCIACGNLDVVLESGVGPHHARLRCPACGAQRWLPKLRVVEVPA